MTLWLANLLAFSVQLAALVATAVAIITVLRVSAPGATLRFWQGVLAVTFVWPACQLLMDGTWAPVGAMPVWISAASAATTQAGVAGVDASAAAAIMAVLAVGLTARLVWFGLGLRRLQLIRGRSEPADALAPIAEPLQRAIGVHAEIRFSASIDGPATMGLLRPVVLLPYRVGQLPEPIQRAVLCHELMHVRRRDWLLCLLEELWCAVLWFHPAARVLVGRLSLARETVVDRATLACTHDRRAYAAALLEFAGAEPRAAGATPFVRRRHLEHRIALLAQEVPMTRPTLALRILVAAAAVAFATTVATAYAPMTAALQSSTDKVYKPSDDAEVTLPRVLKEAKPSYTAQAMQEKIQGSVFMSVVVLASGDVGDVRITQSLDAEHGLDDSAIFAMRQWKFSPGTRRGKPVAVEVMVEMTFTLKK